MHFLKKFAIGAASLGLLLPSTGCGQADDNQAKHHSFSNISTTKEKVKTDGSPGSDLSGIGIAVAAREAFMAKVWYNAVMEQAWYAGIQRLEAERAAQQEAQEQQQDQATSSSSPSGTVSGSCAEMAPPGFPSYIIDRESRGVATADNGSHYGCVQLDYAYLTGDYAADWARLWDNGNGACHWNPPNYCGG